MKGLLVAAIVVMSAACRPAHLGSDHGDAYRKALRAQVERTSRAPALLDERDARDAIEAQHAGGAAAPAGVTGTDR